MPLRSERGYLYLEALVSLLLLGFLAAWISVASSASLERKEAEQALQEVVLKVQVARLEAIARQEAKVLRLDTTWDSGCRVLSNFSGNEIHFSATGGARGGTLQVHVRGRYVGQIILAVATTQIRVVPAR